MNILESAIAVTKGPRAQDYGDVKTDWNRVAALASALMGCRMRASDCAKVLIAVKLSRESHSHKRDNLVDLAGYAWVLSVLEGDEG